MNVQVQLNTRLRGFGLAAARLGWAAAFVLAVSLWAIGGFELATQPPVSCLNVACDPFGVSAEDLALMKELGLPAGLPRAFFLVTNTGIALTFFAIALVIFWRAPNAWLGLTVSFALVYFGAVFFTESDDALWQTHPDLRWLLAVVYSLGYIALMLFFFYFPDGKFVPSAKHLPAMAMLLILLVAPFTVTATRADPPAVLLFLGSVGAGVAAQIYRYRRVSNRPQRQQTKWVMFGLLSAVMVMLIWIFTAIAFPPDQPGPERIYFLIFTRFLIMVLIPLLPLTIAFSILRYRLFDIDFILNRALLYGMLTALIVGLYVLLVGSAGVVLQTNSDLVALLLTGVLAAAAFRPARSLIQRGVDRIVPGQRPHLAPIPPAEADDTSTPRLSGRRLQVARAAWWVAAAIAAGIFIISLPAYLLNLGQGPPDVVANIEPLARFVFAMDVLNALASLAAALLSLVLAAVLFRRKPDDWMALFVSFYLLAHGILLAGPLEELEVFWPGTYQAALQAETTLMFVLTPLLFFLFPSGQFVPPQTRWFALASILPALMSLLVLWPYASFELSDPPLLVVLIGGVALGLTIVYAQIYRYRRVSNSVERQQTKWVVFGLAAWIVTVMFLAVLWVQRQLIPPSEQIPWWASASEPFWFLSMNILPVTLTMAVLRYRLFDIDYIINRALVYGGLTAGVAALYVFVIGGLGLLLQSSSNLLLPLLATGLAAALAQPVRQRLQNVVNRLMYGERDDPAALLSRLGEHLEQTGSPQAALTGIVETAARALKLPYAAIALGERGEIVAGYGLPLNAIQRFPMIYQGETVGQMLVAERAPGEGLTPKDRRLLETVARQAGAAAHAARLTADLRRSRRRLVAAREEERRRLRRDLHDGLGPVLASQGLKMAAAAQLMKDSPAEAQRLLEELAAQNEAAVAEIRRLVYNLRPAALDDLGLVGAVRDYAAGLQAGAGENGKLQIEVEAPQAGLPPLPAAVEAAAYRIAVEALTNVARHAQAGRSAVSFALKGSGPGQILQVEITDNGVGLPPDGKKGVGLISMRERAEEVGGSLFIQSAPGRGSRVLARLPLMDED